jgi:hypothetical protein
VRRRAKISAIALGAVAVTATIGYAFRGALVYEPIRSTAELLLEERLGGEVTLGPLSGSLVRSVEVAGGALDSRGGLPEGARIAFDALPLEYDLVALARGDPRSLSSVDVVRPRNEVDLAAPAKPLPARRDEEESEPSGEPPPLSPLPRLRIRDATIVLRAQGGPRIEIAGIDVRGEPLGAGRKVPLVPRLRGLRATEADGRGRRARLAPRARPRARPRAHERPAAGRLLFARALSELKGRNRESELDPYNGTLRSALRALLGSKASPERVNSTTENPEGLTCA